MNASVKLLSFPLDRSACLPDGQSRVEQAHSFHVVSGASTWDEAFHTRLIALSVMLASYRMTQQEALQVGIALPEGKLRYCSATFATGLTLKELVDGLDIREQPGLDGDEVDVSIVPWGLVSGGVAGLMLRRIVLRQRREGERVDLQLQSTTEVLSLESARDLLEKIAAVYTCYHSQPHTPHAAVSFLTAGARRFVPDLSAQMTSETLDSLPRMVCAVAQRHPGATAVDNGVLLYSYADLWGQVSTLTGELVACGAVRGDVVAIAGRSSFGLIASMIAVLNVGGVILLLDPFLPPERLAQMQARCMPKLLIDTNDGIARSPWGGVLLRTDAWPQPGAGASVVGAFQGVGQVGRGDMAYVFFTSGSTGEPKGVLGSHLGLVHFLRWQQSEFPIGPGDHNAQLTALSFDVVLRDIFFPLTSGSCLHIPERSLLLDAGRLLRWFRDRGITVMHSVPSVMLAWLRADPGDRPLHTLKYIFFAGEPLTDGFLQRFCKVAGEGTQIVNLYGPTETTLAKFFHRVVIVEPGIQPIGRPQPSTEAYIMRDRSTVCGLWEMGEIVIRTPYRSCGYFGQPELTRQVFVANPHGDDANDLLYFTGDLGRLRPHGKFEIFGRIDSQIKIHGVRIEPTEIESELLKIDGVRDGAVTVRVRDDDGKVLWAVVTAKDNMLPVPQDQFATAIRTRLKERLHPAMVPSGVYFTEQLPYLPNGKINRKELAKWQLDTTDDVVLAQTDDAEARGFLKELEKALGFRVSNLDDSFVDLGGDSLSFIRVSLLLEEKIGRLPDDWATAPFSTLLGRRELSSQVDAPRQLSFLVMSSVPVPVLMRALSIVMIVLSHTGAFFTTGTSLLFVISGLSYGSYLEPKVIKTGSLSPVLRFIAGFAVPAGLWQAARAIRFKSVWLPDILLMGTMFQNPRAPHFTFWFLDVLWGNLLLLAGVTLLLRKFRSNTAARSDGHTSEALFVCFVGLGYAFFQVWLGFWDGAPGLASVAPFKWFWLLALGWALSTLKTTRQKWAVTLCLALIAVLDQLAPQSMRDWWNTNDLFYMGIVALIWVPAVRLPKQLKSLVVYVASASLFIYLVNHKVIEQVHAAWPVQLAAALLVGIFAEYAWRTVTNLLKRRAYLL